MSLVVYVAVQGVRVPLAESRIAELARRVLRSEGVTDAMLSIAFISSTAIASMNRRHLRRSGATDVIAFGLGPSGKGGPVIGDVYVAPDVARSNARRWRVPVREEIARLVVHGTLHVLGYDHSESAARFDSEMWKKQEAIMKRGIPPRRRR